MQRRRAFTLIELLVVTATIAIFAAVMFPKKSFAQAKGEARAIHGVPLAGSLAAGAYGHTYSNLDSPRKASAVIAGRLLSVEGGNGYIVSQFHPPTLVSPYSAPGSKHKMQIRKGKEFVPVSSVTLYVTDELRQAGPAKTAFLLTNAYGRHFAKSPKPQQFAKSYVVDNALKPTLVGTKDLIEWPGAPGNGERGWLPFGRSYVPYNRLVIWPEDKSPVRFSTSELSKDGVASKKSFKEFINEVLAGQPSNLKAFIRVSITRKVDNSTHEIYLLPPQLVNEMSTKSPPQNRNQSVTVGDAKVLYLSEIAYEAITWVDRLKSFGVEDPVASKIANAWLEYMGRGRGPAKSPVDSLSLVQKMIKLGLKPETVTGSVFNTPDISSAGQANVDKVLALTADLQGEVWHLLQEDPAVERTNLLKAKVTARIEDWLNSNNREGSERRLWRAFLIGNVFSGAAKVKDVENAPSANDDMATLAALEGAAEFYLSGIDLLFCHEQIAINRLIAGDWTYAELALRRCVALATFLELDPHLRPHAPNKDAFTASLDLAASILDGYGVVAHCTNRLDQFDEMKDASQRGLSFASRYRARFEKFLSADGGLGASCLDYYESILYTDLSIAEMGLSNIEEAAANLQKASVRLLKLQATTNRANSQLPPSEADIASLASSIESHKINVELLLTLRSKTGQVLDSKTIERLCAGIEKAKGDAKLTRIENTLRALKLFDITMPGNLRERLSAFVASAIAEGPDKDFRKVLAYLRVVNLWKQIEPSKIGSSLVMDAIAKGEATLKESPVGLGSAPLITELAGLYGNSPGSDNEQKWRDYSRLAYQLTRENPRLRLSSGGITRGGHLGRSKPSIVSTNVIGSRTGKDHYLVFYFDNYDGDRWSFLNTASSAEALVEDMQRFGFTGPPPIQNPTQDRVTEEILKFRNSGDDHQLIIFTLGHGFVDQKTGASFVATNGADRASKSLTNEQLSNGFIDLNYLAYLTSKPESFRPHTLFVSFACNVGAGISTGARLAQPIYSSTKLDAVQVVDEAFSAPVRLDLRLSGTIFYKDGMPANEVVGFLASIRDALAKSPVASFLLDVYPDFNKRIKGSSVVQRWDGYQGGDIVFVGLKVAKKGRR
jgi:hypothetical protein